MHVDWKLCRFPELLFGPAEAIWKHNKTKTTIMFLILTSCFVVSNNRIEKEASVKNYNAGLLSI